MNFVLVLISLPALLLAQENLAPATQANQILEDIRGVLADTEEPLTRGQEGALRPIVAEATSGESQVGAVIAEQVRSQAGDILTEVQTSALLRAQTARKLLDDGVDGLRQVLVTAGVPPLTFDQETQVQSVYNDHVLALDGMLEANGRSTEAIERDIRTLEDQLLLAALKFLNPAQRTALTGSLSAADFAELNSDLPEDEDELREYLSDLRSPAASGGGGGRSGRGGHGGGGGGVVIDGFGGGRMPNRDEIQEIRINENSFTAEQSNQSRGRTEIITRGGTGRFNGDTTFNFADESLDARNTFASFRPPYQQRNFSTNVSGPLIRNRLTLTFSLKNNTNEDGDTLRAFTPNGLIDDAIVKPRVARGFTLRATAQLSENHVVNASYTYGTVKSTNAGVGGFGLPEQAYNTENDDFNFQIKETAVLSNRFNHEVQFRVGGLARVFKPVNSGVHIIVADAFKGGGAILNGESDIRNYEFSNLLMYSGQSMSLRAGFQGRIEREDVQSRSNYNGTFTFSRLDCLSPDEVEPGEDPCEGAFSAGRPIRYTVKQGDPQLNVSKFESSVFLQTDFRLSQRLTTSLGVRYETQTHVNDYNNFAPRLGFAYLLGSSTVLRGGSGIFHDRLNLRDYRQLVQFDGTGQEELIIRNPTYPNPFLGESEAEIRGQTSAIRSAAEDLASPYSWISEVSIETQLPGRVTVTGSYKFDRGVHRFRSRNTNGPLDITSSVPRSCTSDQDSTTCVRPDPTRGNLILLESTGTSRNHNFRLGWRRRFSFVNINGSYTHSSNYSDTFGGTFSLPADNYDLASEWGRSGARRRFSSSFNLRLPWNINANTGMSWNSGNPYSLRTGKDDNRDTNTNDRPSGVPRNSLTGPGFFEMSMDFSKSVQLRSDRVELAEGATTGPVAGGGYYGQRTGIRMTISARARNLLNNVNYQSFSGVMTSPFFGQPTRARDGRSISTSIRFNW